MRGFARTLAATAVCMAALTATVGLAATTKTVQVDCTKGDSINTALANKTDELVVEIHGICEEHVVVARNDVTLRGADPNTDGVRGVEPAPSSPVITIRGVGNVRLENLAVLDGNGHGIAIRDAEFAVIVNCRILDHARTGVTVDRSGFVTISDSVSTGNGVYGLGTGGAVNVRCLGCTLAGDEAGVDAFFSGFMFLLNSTVTSPSVGILSELGGWVTATSTDVDAPTLLQSLRGHIEMGGGVLGDGRLLAQQKGTIRLNNANQPVNTLASGPHFVGSDSQIRLVDTSTLRGGVEIRGFSTTSIEDSSTLDGALDCDTGGEAFCAVPANVAGPSNCGQCPVP